VLLVRHGRTSANAGGVLAGWLPGIGLDDVGQDQARRLGARMAPVPLAAVVCSPLQRCQETAGAMLAADGPHAATRPAVQTDERLGECRYGEWTGRALKDLTRDPLWRVVQAHPSAVIFPGADGEPMSAMAARAVLAVREHDAAVAAAHGDDAVWAVVSHGDVIKAVLADALGMHLDSFQRIMVDTTSVSAIRYTPLRPFVVRMNDGSGELSALVPPRRRRRRARSRAASSDAVVGGETGAGPSE
jgi:probable phosphomutase (TIGR03848 family)